MTEQQAFQLQQLANADPIYLELRKECIALEDDFCRIRSGLSETDQDLLDRYIALCEELEYQRTCFALLIAGK